MPSAPSVGPLSIGSRVLTGASVSRMLQRTIIISAFVGRASPRADLRFWMRSLRRGCSHRDVYAAFRICHCARSPFARII